MKETSEVRLTADMLLRMLYEAAQAGAQGSAVGRDVSHITIIAECAGAKVTWGDGFYAIDSKQASPDPTEVLVL